ncbi:phage tail tape measure protein [Tenacibaculum sp. nBUS_03]|uniref:phage tail tape measure protein n=1 Tax=Tenacibaculum sp. nBUS_03 TaxID=3395320 RepID=UPI003EB71FEB
MAGLASINIKFFADLKQFSTQMQNANRKLQKMGKQLQGLGTTLSVGVTAPFVGFSIAVSKSFSSFESELSKISDLVGISVGEVNEMGDSAKGMASKYGVSAKSAAEALFYITSAGLRGSDAMNVLEQSLKGSVVGLGDIKTIADLSTSAMNAYGSGVLKASEATDVLTTAVKEGKLDASELSQSMGSVLPLASAMNVSFNEVGATFAALSRTGTNASEAATQLKGILSSILKPTKEAEVALSGMGLSSKYIRDVIKNDGLLSALELLNDKFKGNITATSAVFGNVRALSGVLDLMGSNVGVTRDIFASLNKVVGATDNAFKGTSGTVEFRYNVAMNSLKNSLIDVGKIFTDVFLPLIENLSVFVQDVIHGVNGLDESTKKIIVVVSAFAAALGPLLLSLGFLMTTVIPGLTTAFAGLSAVIVANPLGVLAIALTAVVSGVLLLTSNLGGLTDVTEQWSEVTKKATKSIADEKLQLDKNLIVARDEGKSKKERLKAIDALKKQYPKYLDFLSLENINTQKTKDATNQLIDALLVKAKVQAAQEKMVEVEKKLLDLQLGQNEAIKPSLWQNMGAALKSFGNQTQFQIEQSAIIAENYGKEKTALEDLRDSLRDYISDNDDLVTSLNKVKKASVVPSDTSNKGGRRKVTGILSDQRGEDGKLEQTVNLGIVEGIKVEGEELKTELQGIQQSFIDFSEQTSNIIAESTSSFLAGFGEMIGGLFTGSVTIADIGGMILRTVGDFLKKLGKAAIQVGVAAKAIHLAFTNPFAAIAAGVALIAVGSVFSNLATQQSQGNAVPFAKGGIVYRPTNALIGEYAGASSNPEVVAPLNKLKELITPASQNLDIKVGGLVWTELGKLKVALNQHDIRKTRTT